MRSGVRLGSAGVAPDRTGNRSLEETYAGCTTFSDCRFCRLAVGCTAVRVGVAIFPGGCEQD